MTWRCLPLPVPGTLRLAGFACVDTGSCWECGGWLHAVQRGGIDGRFCSDDCADSYAAYQTRVEEADRQRRQAEDDFADEVARLIAAGYTYEEIDTILEDMP